MDNKLVICMVIFALTLLSYIINKIPMWVTALFITQRTLHYRVCGCERSTWGIRKCQHDPDGRLFHGGVGIPPHISCKTDV